MPAVRGNDGALGRPGADTNSSVDSREIQIVTGGNAGDQDVPKKRAPKGGDGIGKNLGGNVLAVGGNGGVNKDPHGIGGNGGKAKAVSKSEHGAAYSKGGTGGFGFKRGGRGGKASSYAVCGLSSAAGGCGGGSDVYWNSKVIAVPGGPTYPPHPFFSPRTKSVGGRGGKAKAYSRGPTQAVGGNGGVGWKGGKAGHALAKSISPPCKDSDPAKAEATGGDGGWGSYDVGGRGGKANADSSNGDAEAKGGDGGICGGKGGRGGNAKATGRDISTATGGKGGPGGATPHDTTRLKKGGRGGNAKARGGTGATACGGPGGDGPGLGGKNGGGKGGDAQAKTSSGKSSKEPGSDGKTKDWRLGQFLVLPSGSNGLGSGFATARGGNGGTQNPCGFGGNALAETGKGTNGTNGKSLTEESVPEMSLAITGDGGCGGNSGKATAIGGLGKTHPRANVSSCSGDGGDGGDGGDIKTVLVGKNSSLVSGNGGNGGNSGDAIAQMQVLENVTEYEDHVYPRAVSGLGGNGGRGGDVVVGILESGSSVQSGDGGTKGMQGKQFSSPDLAFDSEQQNIVDVPCGGNMLIGIAEPGSVISSPAHSRCTVEVLYAKKGSQILLHKNTKLALLNCDKGVIQINEDGRKTQLGKKSSSKNEISEYVAKLAFELKKEPTEIKLLLKNHLGNGSELFDFEDLEM